MHRIGIELYNAFPAHAPAGEMAESAAKFKISEGEIRWYRQFAALHSVPELEDLYEKCRRGKFAITTTHFRVLICKKRQAAEGNLLRQPSNIDFPSTISAASLVR